MGRRLVITAGDIRIARPGGDAETDDVNDRLKIAFALSRDAMGRVASAGSIQAVNTLVPFAETFADPPPVILGTLKGGRTLIDDYLLIYGNGGRYQYTTPYIPVVTTTGIGVTTPMDTTYGLAAGDGFVYIAVA